MQVINKKRDKKGKRMVYDIDIKEGLSKVEVFDGRKFTYRFTPAVFSKGAPLLVIFSARGTTAPSKFNRKEWNILSVIDTFGRKGDMSAYLGEKGDFFIKELVYELVQATIKECECVPEENLFFYSSSIASGGAIIQGILCDARAVYLNAPIIRVHDTTMYKSQYMECDKNIDYVIPPHMKNVDEADAVRFLKAHSHKKLPTFFLCDSMHQSEAWLENFLEEQTQYFVNACKEEGVEVHLELIDTEGHKIHRTTQEVIGLFETHTPPKYLDIITVTTSLDNNTLQVKSRLGEDYPLTGDEKFAFYLMHKEERIEVKNYSKENETSFVLADEVDIDEVEIRAFVKSVDGKVIQEIVRTILS